MIPSLARFPPSKVFSKTAFFSGRAAPPADGSGWIIPYLSQWAEDFFRRDEAFIDVLHSLIVTGAGWVWRKPAEKDVRCKQIRARPW
jgi:hypothetical protein